jgi:acyl-[acyl-carrier-protein]-phospholipid O-acyltransferase/long-chain-fatty-acid--[acyl-carrier-protein] ligase
MQLSGPLNQARYAKLLRDGGFEALLWTHFLCVFNVSALLAQAHGRAIFAIPFLVFAGFSGQIADRFSKTRVLQITMTLQVAIMALGNHKLMTAALVLLASQAAFFSAAMFGIVPEFVGETRVTRAYGLLLTMTPVAIAAGIGFGQRMGLGLVGVAIAGAAVSLRIRKVSAAVRVVRFHYEKSLAPAVFGISWFWFAGAFFVMTAVSVPHIAAIAVGIGLGSLTAGALSGDYIELGLVPAGLAVMGIALIRWGNTASFVIGGFGAGLFVVPLYAFLRGRAMSVNNFANAAGVVAAFGAFWILHDRLYWLGAAMLAGSFYLAARMPETVMRFALWCMVKLAFRIRVVGGENIPRTGHALLVSNHISYADAVLVGYLARWRTVHFLMWQPIFDIPVARYFFRVLQAIPIDAASPKTTIRALRAAREELKNGELVGIFPEGEMSRTGDVRPFERGFEKILQGSEAPLIPIRIDGLYGHPLSCKGGAPFRSWRKLWRPSVTVRIGAPIRGQVTPVKLREAVVRA